MPSKRSVILLLTSLVVVGLLTSCVQEAKQSEIKQSLVNLDHLNHLSEEILLGGRSMVILHLYSSPPDYKWLGESAGNATVDDTSRAAITYLKYYEYYGDKKALAEARKCLNFVMYMQTEDGEFYNFIQKDFRVGKDGKIQEVFRINKHSPVSEKSFNWWGARALWALGYGYRVFHKVDPSYAKVLEERILLSHQVIREQLKSYGTYFTLHGVKIPAWFIGGHGGADVSAYTVLGLLEYYSLAKDPLIADSILKISDGIAQYQLGSWLDFPYRALMDWGGSISQIHFWGHRQAAALAKAGMVFNKPEWIRAAEDEANSLFVRLLIGGMVKQMSPVPIPDGQIAYGISSIVQGFLALYEATGIEDYAKYAGLAATWFMGNNIANTPMYDPRTGRGYDGIDWRSDREIYEASVNSGAESTIEALMTLMDVINNPAANKYLEYKEEHAIRYQILEAEDARIIAGKPEIIHTQRWMASGQKFIKMGFGDRIELDFSVKKPGRYILSIAYKKQPELLEKVAALISVDDLPPILHLQGSSPDSEYPWMDRLPMSLDLAAGVHHINIEYAGEWEEGKIYLDSLIVQPLVSSVTLVNPQGKRITVVQNYEKQQNEIEESD